MKHHLHIIIVPGAEQMEEEAIYMIADANQIKVLELYWHIPVGEAIEHVTEVTFAKHHRWKSGQVFAHVIPHSS